ncbi:MAG: outer membrane beta-barrel protein [Deltaproteobacteria bacterium]|nr:outer membrane beta-barrel protein [Deltaproteobacteria bacterium]
MRIIKSALFFSLVFLFPAISYTAENAPGARINFGGLEVHPYLVMKERYTDNVYATGTLQRQDTVTTTVPGLKLQWPVRMHYLEAEYNTALERHDTYSEDNTQDQALRGLAKFNIMGDFTLQLRDDYARGHEPRGSSSTGFIEKFDRNAAGGSIEYKLADISKIEVDYTAVKQEFLSSKFRNRIEHLAQGFVYFRFLPKTSAFLEYDVNNFNFDRDAPDLDNTAERALGGVTWEVSEQLKGTIKGGYQWKKFNDPTIMTYDTWVASLDITHALSDYTSIKLIGERKTNESNLQTASFFQTTGGFAEFSHFFTRSAGVTLNGSYGRDKYTFKNAPRDLAREDVYVSGGIGFKYLPSDMIEAAVHYRHRTRNSTQDAFDYDENSYSVTLNVGL